MDGMTKDIGPPLSTGTDADMPREHFPTLGALYDAMRREDEPPGPGFSDRLVPGEGPAHARLMLVGEQPGDQEDLIGRPFVGPAGKLLDLCLKDTGIDRDRVFVTNAVKRFKYTPRGKRRLHARPNSADVTHYRWWLNEEIRLVDPRVIVALGSTALQALTGTRQTIAPLRGKAIPLGRRLLVATVHPSMLLRLRDEGSREDERRNLVRDLRIAEQADHAHAP